MAKILLISANITTEPYPVYPLGMSILAHDLRGRGHDVSEWDFLAEGESLQLLLDHVAGFSPDFTGISIRNIDSCNYSNHMSYGKFYMDLVKSLRACSGRPIVIGGAGFSLFPERLLEMTGADYGIVGEGEGVFASLVEDLQGGIRPAGRILKRDRPLSGRETVVAERSPAYAAYYLKHGGMLNIQTKRGCPLRCAYCSYPALEGTGYRFRPPGDVADEMQVLAHKHKADYFFMADSVFNDSAGRYLEIAEEIVRREMRVRWTAYFKPQKFRHEDVALLKRSGLTAVEWGTDCSTDRTLKGMGKSFDWSDVEESNRLFSKAGVSCAHFVIFGGPEESEDSVLEGLANLERLENCVVFAATGIRVFPETPVHKRAIKEGAMSTENDLLEPWFYFSPGVSFDYLDREIRRSFGSRIDRVYPTDRDIGKIKALHGAGHRGPVWDLLLGGKRSRSVEAGR